MNTLAAYFPNLLIAQSQTTTATPLQLEAESYISLPWVFVAVLSLALVYMLYKSWRTNQSLQTLRSGALRLAQGELTQRIDVDGPGPLALLAQSLNQMAAQLDDRLSTVIQQRNEMGAVLSSMVEGVTAVDRNEQIISLNRAAASLLQINAHQAIGRSIQEVIRNVSLQEYVSRTILENQPFDGEVTMNVGDEPDTEERNVQFQTAVLYDAAGQRIGAVMVLHDVTQLRRLESVRREFVANVSHEVRTPISAIKAAVETLEDDPQFADNNTGRFLRIVGRQADRLASIVEDLLSLARIEEDAEAIFSELQDTEIAAVLRASRDTVEPAATQKQMTLEVQCDPALHVRINAPLLEQALINLIDNAVKYSGDQTTVHIRAEQNEQELVLAVTDQGRGIEPNHLPRIFERFYRTDKARSRELGGTGLGLSIVKHIAQAHGGRVDVESTPGRGSTFKIHLPISASTEADADAEEQA